MPGYARTPMRVALHHTGEVGVRAGRILLGDRRVEVLGLIDSEPTERIDGRVEEVTDWTTYDVVVTDSREPAPIVRRAVAAGASCVVWFDANLSGLATADAVILTGANLASGIAPCLASHEIALSSEVGEVIVAWTEPGTPLRSGEPLAFPDPIGGRWGRARGNNRYVAPVAGDWAGAMVRVSSKPDATHTTRIVGVADLAPHLEALALAAGTLAVGAGSYEQGVREATNSAEAFLAEALGAGLDVAAYTLTGT